MTSVGIIEGTAEGVASILKTYSGFLSDRWGKRKPFILVGYFLAAISKPLIGISESWLHVFIARGIDRTGKGLRTSPRDALIDDSVAPNFRGAAFGFHRFMDTLGAVLGPLIALIYLFYYRDDLRSAYFYAFIPGIFAFFIVFAVQDKKQEISAKPFQTKWNFSLFKPGFKRYLLAWGLFSVANSSDVFLLMRAKQIGFTLVEVILLYCFYNLTYSLSSPFFGALSDSIDRKKIMIAGLGMFILVYAGFIFASAHWMFWLFFAIYGLYMGATEGVGKALVMDYVDSDLKASAQGIFGTLTGVATILASIFAGLLWDHLGPGWAFGFAILGAISSLFILIKG